MCRAVPSQLRGGQHSPSAGLRSLAPTAEGALATPDGAAHLCRSWVAETGVRRGFPGVMDRTSSRTGHPEVGWGILAQGQCGVRLVLGSRRKFLTHRVHMSPWATPQD